MAIDSKEKRMAAAHAGRIWMRGAYSQSLNASQRAASGIAYPVATFANPAPITSRPPGLQALGRQFATISAARLGGVLQ